MVVPLTLTLYKLTHGSCGAVSAFLFLEGNLRTTPVGCCQTAPLDPAFTKSNSVALYFILIQVVGGSALRVLKKPFPISMRT